MKFNITARILYGVALLIAVDVTGTQYIGCYKDTKVRAMLHYDLADISTNTNQRCINNCKSKSFTFAATQNGNACFCDESYDRFGISTECTVQCMGDLNQTCGGSYANSVYSVCPFGKFGMMCDKSCPINCKKEPNFVCQLINGTCVYGCYSNQYGPYCDEATTLKPLVDSTSSTDIKTTTNIATTTATAATHTITTAKALNADNCSSIHGVPGGVGALIMLILIVVNF